MKLFDIKLIFLATIFILAFVVVSGAGCNGIAEPELDTKTITISGVGTQQTINEVDPIILVVSGVENTITVTSSTPIEKIILSGVDNVVYISVSHTPEIIQSGVDNKILYYDQ